MKGGCLKYPVVVVLSVALSACGVTKHLPAEGYMLTKSKIETDSEAPAEERIKAGELNGYVRQLPSKKLLWTNFPAWLYLQADPAKDNGWNNFIRKLGSEPVLLDSTLTDESAELLKRYMIQSGFYEAESDYTIMYNKHKRKAKVTYTVRQNRPFRINSLSYDFHDDFLEQVILEDSASTSLAAGDIFDSNVLGDERKRITDYLQNRGYYNFAQQNISFVADTTIGDHLVDLTMVVRQHLTGYDAENDPVLENNSVYRIREIIVHSDYDPALAATDQSYNSTLDTIDYNGLRIVSHGKSKIQPGTLRRAIKLYPDYIYSYEDEQRTYDDLLHLNYYKSARIDFSEVATTGDNLVTYIGDGTATHTTEKSLVCHIYCTPALKQAYTVNLEASYTSMYYGLKPSVSYMNRNLFRGAEMFNLSLSGGYEFNNGKQNVANSFEIGGTASLYFPRFIAPFRVDRANRLAGPQTRLEFSIIKQNRGNFYDRIISGGHIAYTWSNGRRSSYEFRPIDINVIRVSRVDENFLLGIRNRYLWSSYQSQLVPAISGTYMYSTSSHNGTGSSFKFRLNVEMAGNLTYLLSSAMSEKVPQTIDPANSTQTVIWNAYEVFKIPFSQYFRAEASISRLIPLGERTALAYRLLAGIGVAYGNAQSMPYDRQFYAGGNNSMRGWPVRGLGPGDSNPSNTRFDMARVGNMRLEANVEMRFPLWSSFRGALFFDAGNIWNALIPGGTEEDGIFRFDTFFPQLGLNTGIGIRYDLGIAVIRLDWGIRLHDPGKPLGQRWIHNFQLSNTALNFGIGYPF